MNPKKPDPELTASLNKNPDLARLFDLLSQLIKLLQTHFKTRWNRNISIGDLFSNRWSKAEALGFGEGTSVYDNVLVLGDVKVGRECWIGPNTILDGSGGLKIGDHCTLSAGVQVYTHDSVARSISGGKAEIQRKPTQIGSRCYLGPNCIISMGVTIGDQCIIGANSLVTKDIPPGSKAYGSPCRIVGTTS